MTRGWLLGGSLLVGAVAASGTLGLTTRVSAQGEAVWLSGFAEAQVSAKESGKPIFLVFR